MQISKGWVAGIIVIALLCALVVSGLFYFQSAKQTSQLRDELRVVSQKLESVMTEAKNQAEPAAEEAQKEAVAPATATSTGGTAIIRVEKGAKGGTYVSKNGDKIYEFLSLPNEEFVEVIYKQTANYLYIAGKQSGFGGYILYNTFFRSLKRIDMQTGEIKEIVPRGQLGIHDISVDEKYVVFGDGVNNKIVVRQMNTLADINFSVDQKYGQFGDAYFSPDGSKIVYSAALSNPSGEEAGAIITIDIASGKSVIYKQTTKAGTYFRVTGWNDKGIQYTIETVIF